MKIRPRSMLFVSGEKSERFPKAFAAGADLVCIDLEDAVHPERKAEARAQVLAWLAANPAAPGQAHRSIRINGLRTLDGLRDLLALAESGLQLDALLIPKTESPADLQAVQAWVGVRAGALIALLETPLAIERAFEIAQAGAGLGALMLGGADLSAELDAQFGWDGLRHARGRLVNAAKAAGVQAWDVPHIDLADTAGLADETRRVLALGFDCKTAIHPQQLAAIHAAFLPTPVELDWARTLLQAVPAGGASGAFLFQGRMVDAPLLRKAQRIVERAARA
jgi:citrate lyase subunit beta/citryl-CoA lyase/(S)-citramalyl-CoA lyase